MSLLSPRRKPILRACIALVVMTAFIQGVYAEIFVQEYSSFGGYSSASSLGPLQRLDDIGAGNNGQPQASPAWWNMLQETDQNMIPRNLEGGKSDGMDTAQEGIEPEGGHIYRSNWIKEMLVPVDEISGSDVFLDVSESAIEHIPGAVGISYEEFILDDGTLKSVQEIAEILGKAGISHDDSLVVYGECMPCGGGPAPSTYIYWMLKSLGHKNIKVMDGAIDDWKASGRLVTSSTQTKPKANYVPEFISEYTATYDYIIDNNPQVVDARTKEDFEYGSIPGAINIPYDNILDGDWITDEASLESAFSMLTKERPVVVFTQTGIKGSVVWFALKLMGYDAKLYSYQDWLINQVPNNYTSNIH